MRCTSPLFKSLIINVLSFHCANDISFCIYTWIVSSSFLRLCRMISNSCSRHLLPSAPHITGYPENTIVPNVGNFHMPLFSNLDYCIQKKKFGFKGFVFAIVPHKICLLWTLTLQKLYIKAQSLGLHNFSFVFMSKVLLGRTSRNTEGLFGKNCSTI